MNNMQVFLDRQITEMRPDLENFLWNRVQEAYKKATQSEEFEEIKQTFFDSDEYKEIQNTLATESNIKSYVNYVEDLIETFWVENENNKDIKGELHNILTLDEYVPRRFNIKNTWSVAIAIFSDKDVTYDNYSKKLLNLVKKEQERHLEELIDRYASDKMKLTAYVSDAVRKRFEAIIVTAPRGTLESLKSLIENSIDFDAVVRNKEINFNKSNSPQF